MNPMDYEAAVKAEAKAKAKAQAKAIKKAEKELMAKVSYHNCVQAAIALPDPNNECTEKELEMGEYLFEVYNKKHRVRDFFIVTAIMAIALLCTALLSKFSCSALRDDS